MLLLKGYEICRFRRCEIESSYIGRYAKELFSFFHTVKLRHIECPSIRSGLRQQLIDC